MVSINIHTTFICIFKKLIAVRLYKTYGPAYRIRTDNLCVEGKNVTITPMLDIIGVLYLSVELHNTIREIGTKRGIESVFFHFLYILYQKIFRKSSSCAFPVIFHFIFLFTSHFFSITFGKRPLKCGRSFLAFELNFRINP